jgi:ATP-dependent Clp protease protease subunit
MAEKHRLHESQEIWVNKFDELSAQEFRAKLMSKVTRNPEEPIIVYIDSFGGDADALLMMIETINEVPNLIITACMGKAMSAGAILLAMGDVRFCSKNSRIMVHEITSGTQIGRIYNVVNDAQEGLRLNKHIYELFAKKCGFKKGYEEFRKLMKLLDADDLYLTPENALKLGIVDQIGIPVVASQISYMISKLDDTQKTVEKLKAPNQKLESVKSKKKPR